MAKIQELLLILAILQYVCYNGHIKKEVVKMSRCTVYLTDANARFMESIKDKFGSISKVVQYSLEKLQRDRLKEYYLQKSETYSKLHKAQAKVIQQQEKEEQL